MTCGTTFRAQGAEAGVPLEVMMAQRGNMDRETSLEYVHIQQRALEPPNQLIESEQAEILAATQKKQSLEEKDKAADQVAARNANNHAAPLPPMNTAVVNTAVVVDGGQEAAAGVTSGQKLRVPTTSDREALERSNKAAMRRPSAAGDMKSRLN